MELGGALPLSSPQPSPLPPLPPAGEGRGEGGPDPQAEARAFLTNLSGADPRETQISAVFIGEDTVWKLKRAVRLPFLDFTTADSRRNFLQREIELSGVAAPGLYRDVVPITTGPGGLAIGGDGPVIDWVLRMARVPDTDFMLHRVAAGLDGGLLDALGDMVAADHAIRPPAKHHDPLHPGRNARKNALSAIIAGLPRRQVAAWLLAAEQALDAATPLLAARSAAGLVRRAHGDLHLGNICVWRGAPVPFDALEFDEAMATIDLAYDMAFLLMDLDRRAGRPAANRVLNRYVARTGDAALVRLLPGFLSRRAMVRAHVEGDPGFLDAALGYLRPAPDRVIAIGGLPGTGKSTLARALAPTLGAAPGALIARSDEIRKRLFGVAPEARLGPEGYTPAAGARVDAALLDAVRQSAGHAVILDATFLSPALRDAVRACGRPFTGIWLEAPVDELARRIRARSGDASDATEAVLHRLAARDPGVIDWHRVPADATAQSTCFALAGLLESTKS
jgi:aminoglycoside phosphotransferase family enzyme/predicted kinase